MADHFGTREILQYRTCTTETWHAGDLRGLQLSQLPLLQDDFWQFWFWDLCSLLYLVGRRAG